MIYTVSHCDELLCLLVFNQYLSLSILSVLLQNIVVGSVVSVILPGQQLPVIGTITDIEDDLGRLHLKVSFFYSFNFLDTMAFFVILFYEYILVLCFVFFIVYCIILCRVIVAIKTCGYPYILWK